MIGKKTILNIKCWNNNSPLGRNVLIQVSTVSANHLGVNMKNSVNNLSVKSCVIFPTCPCIKVVLRSYICFKPFLQPSQSPYIIILHVLPVLGEAVGSHVFTHKGQIWRAERKEERGARKETTARETGGIVNHSYFTVHRTHNMWLNFFYSA